MIAVSRSNQVELRHAGYVPGNRLWRVENGLDIEMIRSLSQESQAPEWDWPRVVMTTGYIREEKNPLFLADASARIYRRVPDVGFIWVGDGELRPALEARVAELGISHRWLITGWRTNPFPLLRQATVFALPSRYESFGLSILEAMALRKPIVAMRVPGPVDLVSHGVNGLLAPPGDVAAFSEGVIQLLLEEHIRETMGLKSVETAGRFTVERMARETMAAYASALEGSHP
jgi:glycosyltransferase involved in cell wall biosynthesis